jgi:hypothetical protein
VPIAFSIDAEMRSKPSFASYGYMMRHGKGALPGIETALKVSIPS